VPKALEFVVGSRWGTWEVLRVLEWGPRGGVTTPAGLLEVRCLSCGAERSMDGDALCVARWQGSTSCRKCRAREHARAVPCGGCGTYLERFVVAHGVPRCDVCKQREHSRLELIRRNREEGRRCRTCGRTDREARFLRRDECGACNRAAARNGRCACGRAIKKSLGKGNPVLRCPCSGVPVFSIYHLRAPGFIFS
jgi:hypothetical protein